MEIYDNGFILGDDEIFYPFSDPQSIEILKEMKNG